MKPALFSYVRADSVDQVLDLLQQHGDEAAILAGGQSLVPMLNMRFARPGLVVDINELSALAGIERTDDALRIGALTRYVELAQSELLRAELPLIAAALPQIAHPAIRNRGTIGGSLALADPAAEMPACAVALDATVVLRSRGGERTVPAQEFVTGTYATERREDELLTEIRFPLPAADAVSSFYELSRRHGDFALAGAACHGRADGGRLHMLRLVCFGVEDRPVLAERAAAAACAGPLDDEAFARVAAALDDDLEPVGGIHGDAAFKRQLARVAVERALRQLTSTAGGERGG